MSARPSAVPPANPLPQPNVDELNAQYDEELPQRTLTRRLDRGVGIMCFVVSLFVLKQVFFPLSQSGQYYLRAGSQKGIGRRFIAHVQRGL